MGYLLLLAYIVITMYALKFRGVKAIKFLIFVCFFQNFILVLFGRFMNASLYTIFVFVKEAYVILFITLAIVTGKKIDKRSAFCILAIGILLGLWALNGSGEFKGQLTSFRQLCLPFLFYVYGKYCKILKEDLIEIIEFYIKCCVVSVLFGIAEMILGEKIWGVLGISDYARIKGISMHMTGGLFKSFFSYDFFGVRLRRMASFLVDPVILGQLLAYGFVVSVFYKGVFNRKKRIIASIIIGIGLVCTLGKGGIVIAAFSTCILLGRVAKKKVLSNALFILGAFVFASFALKSIASELSGSAHFNGLFTGFQSMVMHPLGTGIGTAGNMADSYSGFGYQAVAGDESYIGSLMAQTGVIGLSLNLIFWKFFLGRTDNSIEGKYITVLNILNIGLFLTSFINYTAISFNSCFIFIILAAAAKNMYHNGYKMEA